MDVKGEVADRQRCGNEREGEMDDRMDVEVKGEKWRKWKR